MKHLLKFPLVNSFRMLLPAGTRIVGVTIENDVAKLRLEDFPADAVCKAEAGVIKWERTRSNAEGRAGNLATESHDVFSYMEGETKPVIVDGKKHEEKIKIPKATETLRFLGKIKTKADPATFHVFTTKLAAN